MIWNPFARWGPDVNALALKQNLKTYVNAYTNIRNKNNKSALPPLNTKIVNALKRYINSKRPKAAGAAAAAVNNAGGNNANAAAAAVGVTQGNGTTPYCRCKRRRQTSARDRRPTCTGGRGCCGCGETTGSGTGYGRERGEQCGRPGSCQCG